MLELPSVWLPRRRIIRPGDADFRLPPIGPVVPVRAAIALDQASTTVIGGPPNGIQFGAVIPAGRLLTIFPYRRASDANVPTPTVGGWTTVYTQLTEANGFNIGVLFAKISTGSALDGGPGNPGAVGSWNNADGFVGAVWTGATSEIAANKDESPGAQNPPLTFTRTRTPSPAAGGIAIMTTQLRSFSSNSLTASGGASLIGVSNGNSDFCAGMFYRLAAAAGALPVSVDIVDGAAYWEWSSAAAFNPPSGGSFGGEPGGGVWSG